MPGLPVGLTPTLPQLPNLVSGLPISALPITADISKASVQKNGGDSNEDGVNSPVHGKSGEGNSTKSESHNADVSSSTTGGTSINSEVFHATTTTITNPVCTVSPLRMTPSYQAAGVHSSLPNYQGIAPSIMSTMPLLPCSPTVQPSTLMLQANSETMQVVAQHMLQIRHPATTVPGTGAGTNVTKFLSQVSLYAYCFDFLSCIRFSFGTSLFTNNRN